MKKKFYGIIGSLMLLIACMFTIGVYASVTQKHDTEGDISYDPAIQESYLLKDWQNKLTNTGVDLSTLTSITFTQQKQDIPIGTIPISIGAKDKTGTTQFDQNANCYDISAYIKNTSLVFYSPKIIYAPEDCSYLFSNTASNKLSNLSTLSLKNFDTSNTTKLDSIFKNCSNISTLDLSLLAINVGATTTDFFGGCTNLKTIQTPKTTGAAITLPTLTNKSFYKVSNLTSQTSISVSSSSFVLKVGALVTANPNGGTISNLNGWKSATNPTKVVLWDNNAIGTLPDATKTGHAIDGWYTSETAGTKVTSSTTFNQNSTIFAHWNANACAITYKLNGGTNASGNPTSYNYSESSQTISVNAPTKVGYDFAGWTVTNGSISGTTLTINAKADSVTLEAKWTASKYTITYKDQGDVAFSGTHADGYPRQHTYGTATTLKGASKTGYTFGGWFANKDCSGSAITTLGATSYTSAITLYAKWTKNNYNYTVTVPMTGTAQTVTITANGQSKTVNTNNGTATFAIPYGTKFTPSIKVAYTSGRYNLVWGTSATANRVASGTSINRGSELTMTESGLSDTVKLTQLYFATAHLSKNVGTDATYYIGTTNNPTTALTNSQEYYFLSNANITLYAKATFTSGKYNYTFGNAVATPVATGTVVNSGAFAPTYAGVTKILTISQLYTLQAKANGNGTVTPASEIYVLRNGSASITATPTNETGYTTVFTNWAKTSGACTIASTSSANTTISAITSNTVVTATFTRTINSYTLTANANNGTIASTTGWTGTGATATKSVQYNAAYGTLPSVSRTGYTFKGWYTSATAGTKVETTTKMGTADTTIYAQWTANKYNIVYTLNNGTNASGNPTEFTYSASTQTKTVNNPTRTGYTFAGWTVDGGTISGTTLTITAGRTSDVTLTANWIANEYNINYELDGGTAASGNPSKFVYSDERQTFEAKYPTKTGYTCTGWTANCGETLGTIVGIEAGWAQDVVVTAIWKAQVYTITYKDQGDAEFSGTHADGYPRQHTYGTATTLKGASKTGYAFGGWFANKECTNSAITTLGATTYTSNITLYAKWTKNNYNYTVTVPMTGTAQTVTITANGQSKTVNTNNGTATFAIPYGTKFTPSIKVAYTSGRYNLVWGTSATANRVASGTSINRGSELTMTESGLSDTVKLTQLYFATAHLSKNVGTDATYYIGTTNNPTTALTNSQEYYFLSNANITLYAKATFTSGKYNYTFGNAVATPVATGTVVNSGAFAPTYAGVTKILTISQLYTLQAKANGNGTVTPASEIYVLRNGSASITATPTNETGYTTVFTNWAKTSGACTIASTSSANTTISAITSNTVVTATFTRTAKIYTVTYESKTNGGTTVNQTKTVAYGSNVDLTLTATKDGWTFVGWNTSSTATTKLNSYSMPANDVTLYAIFSKVLTGTFNYYNNQTQKVSVTIFNTATNGTITAPSALGTPSGYTFRHWSTANTANAAKTVDASNSITISTNTIYYGSYQKTVTGTFCYSAGTTSNYSDTATQKTATATATQYMNYTGTKIESNFTVPSAVTSSVGSAIAKTYKGVAITTNSTAVVTPTTANTTFYAVYSEGLTFYYFNGTAHTNKAVERRMLSNGTQYKGSLDKDEPVPSAYDGGTFTSWQYQVSPDTSYTRQPLTTGVNVLYAKYTKSVEATFNYYNGTAAVTAKASANRYYVSNTSNSVSTFNNTITVPSAVTANRTVSSVVYTYRGVRVDDSANGTVLGASEITTANTNYYASYSYTVTLSFNGNGSTSGTAPANVSGTAYMKYNGTKVGASLTLPANPFAKTGYTLDATNPWNTNTAGTGTAYKAQTSYSFTTSVILYAKWTINSYTLTANANNGTIASTTGWTGTGATATKSVQYNDAYGTLPTVTRTGFGFKGWFTSETGGTQVSGTTKMGTANTTIYAHWDANGYTIIYNLGGGTNADGNPTSFSYSASAQTKTVNNPTRTGYTFAGWTVDGGTISGTTLTIAAGRTSDVTLTANWTINKFTVTIATNNSSYGSVDKTSIADVPYGSAITVNGNKITINGTTVTATAKTITGYTTKFKDWTNATGTITAARTITANFTSTINSYTLTANANNGTIASTTGWTGTGATATKSVQYNAQYGTLPTVSRTGYTFKGWYTSATAGTKVETTTKMGASATTIYAQWTANKYNIVYTLNNGTNASGNPTSFSYSASAQTKTVNNPTRTGYTFAGWTVDGGTISGTTLTIAAGRTSDVTLTANWTINKFTVTIATNNSSYGSVDKTSIADVPYGSAITVNGNKITINGTTVTATAKTITGYTTKFKDWTNATGTITAARTITANFTSTINSYTLTANANNGTIASTTGWTGTGATATKSVQYNAQYGTLPNVSRTGYTFKGWYTSATAGTKVETTTKMGAANTTIWAQWTQNVSYFANATLFKNILTAQSVDTATITSIKFTKSASDIPASPTKTFSIGASDNTGTTAYTSSANCADITAYLAGTSLVFYSQYTIYAPKSCYQLFNPAGSYITPSFTAVKEIVFSNFDTSNVTDMSGMFEYCNSLVSLNLSGFDTQNVGYMTEMFRYCSSLKALDLNSFDTANVMDMDGMFWECNSLASLNVTSFDTSNVASMGSMFDACNSLETLNLSSFEIIDDAEVRGMLSGTSVLKTIQTPKTVNVAIDLSSGNFFKSSDLATSYSQIPVGTASIELKLGYTITANANNGAIATTSGWKGSGSTATKVVLWDNNTIGTLPTASRTGYTFKGWYTSATAGTKVETTGKISENTTIYAQWEVATVSLTATYYGGGNEYTETFTVDMNSTVYLVVDGAMMKYSSSSNAEDNANSQFGKIETDANYTLNADKNIVTINVASTNINIEMYGYTSMDVAYKASEGGKSFGSYDFTTTVNNLIVKQTYYFVVRTDNIGAETIEAYATFEDADPACYGPISNVIYTNGDYSIINDDLIVVMYVPNQSGMTAMFEYVPPVVRYNIIYLDQNGDTFSGVHESGYPILHTEGTDTALKSATKVGYTFGGWFTNSACTGDAITTLGANDYTSDITLYAKWTINQYTITAHANGGSVVETTGWTGSGESATKSVTYLTAYGTLPQCTTDVIGMAFGGWYTEESGGTKVDASTVMSSSDVTIYAHYTTVTYQIYVYNDVDGTTTNYDWSVLDVNGKYVGYRESGIISYGETICLPNGITGLIGWRVAKQDSNFEYSLATWGKSQNDIIREFTRYTNEQGMIDCSYSDEIFIKNLSSTVGATLSIYPVFEITNKTITFDVYFNNTSSSDGIAELETVVWSAFTNFASISVNGERQMDGYLTDTESYHTTMPANGTTVFSIGNLFDNSQGTLIGWLRNTVAGPSFNCSSARLFINQGNGDVEITSTTADIRILKNAHIILRCYEGTVYRLICDTNNGVLASLPDGWGAADDYSANKSLIENTVIGEMPTATRAGYDFVGWYTTKDSGGTKVTSSDRMFSANTTLYARWSLKNIAINYILYDGGTNSDSNPTSFVYSASAQTVEIPGVPTRSGYKFLKWVVYGGATNGSVDNTSTPAVLHVPAGRRETITLVARWAKSYNVYFNSVYVDNDSTTEVPISDPNGYIYASGHDGMFNAAVMYEGATGLPTASRTGYYFLGWTVSVNGSDLDRVDFPVGVPFSAPSGFADWSYLYPVFTKESYLRQDWYNSISKDITTSIIFINDLNSISDLVDTTSGVSVGAINAYGEIAWANTSRYADVLAFGIGRNYAMTYYIYSPCTIYAPYNSGGLFLGLTKLKSINFGNFDTSKAKYTDSMFRNCSSFESLDLSSFVTTSIESMGWMFQNCSALTSLDLSSFDTLNCDRFTSMFENCSSLTKLDLSNFYVSVNADDMLKGCTALEEVYAPKLNKVKIDLPSDKTWYNMIDGSTATAIGAVPVNRTETVIFKTTPPTYTLTSTERSTGIVTMGYAENKDVQWKCFAYSTDGTTWTKCTGAIPTSAKYAYFVLDTYVSSLDKKAYLAEDKYEVSSSDLEFYHSDSSTPSGVYATDYYYSDVRKILNTSLVATLGINANNNICKAIQGRTLNDLYKLNALDSNKTPINQTSPKGATMTTVDKFWIMSYNEADKYFDDVTARQWNNGNQGVNYWLRSPNSSSTIWEVFLNGQMAHTPFAATYCIRPAFQLRLA